MGHSIVPEAEAILDQSFPVLDKVIIMVAIVVLFRLLESHMEMVLKPCVKTLSLLIIY